MQTKGEERSPGYYVLEHSGLDDIDTSGLRLVEPARTGYDPRNRRGRLMGREFNRVDRHIR